MDYLPKRLPDLLMWFANFAAKIGDYATVLDLSEADLLQVAADYEAMRVVVLGQQVRQTDAQEWTRYRDELLFGKLDTPAPPLPTSGEVGMLPEKARGAIVLRLRRLVARLKPHPNYREAIGIDLGIVGRAAKLLVQPPRLRAVAETSYHVRLQFAMRGHALIEIQSRRGDAEAFETLGYDVRSPYVDARPPLEAGQREIRDYRARYLNADHQPVSEWSAVVTEVARD